MGWNYNGLDRRAQKLVLDAKERDVKSLDQASKMRETIAFGLEKFWEEHLRLQNETKSKSESQYWKETWDTLVEIMNEAKIKIPNDNVDSNAPAESTQQMAEKLWSLDIDTQRFTLATLAQLCDRLIFWTYMYK